MTWTKLGSEFWPECLHHGLSDAAARTHAEAIAYIYEVEEMSCTIPKRLVRTFAGSEDSADAIEALVSIGWWKSHADKWEVLHHADVIRQSLAAQLGKRIRDKKAQRTHRQRQNPTDGTTGVSADVSADVIPDTDRQTDKQLGGHVKTNCSHGVPAGDKPDSWFSEGMACADCARERKGA